MVQLKVEGVSKSFDGEPVIQDISIELNKGELVSLLGISGGGKTTLFNIIAGLYICANIINSGVIVFLI